MNFCPKCGNRLQQEQKFCDNCGTSISKSISDDNIASSSADREATNVNAPAPQSAPRQQSAQHSSLFKALLKYFSIHERWDKYGRVFLLHLPFIIDLVLRETNADGMISWLIFPTLILSAVLIILDLKKDYLPKIIAIISSSYFIYGVIFFIRGAYNKHYVYGGLVSGIWYALPMWTQALTFGSLSALLILFIRGDIFNASRLSPKPRTIAQKGAWAFAILLTLYSISIPIHYVATQSARSNAAIGRIFDTWCIYTSKVDTMVKDSTQRWPIRVMRKGDEPHNFDWYQGMKFIPCVEWNDHLDYIPENRAWASRFIQSSVGFFTTVSEYHRNSGDYWLDIVSDYYVIAPSSDYPVRVNEVIKIFTDFRSYQNRNNGEHWSEMANYRIFYRFSSLEYQDPSE